MSTHAYIGIENPNGTVDYVYSHFDGYLSYTGQILSDNYNTPEAARALVESGDQRAVGDPYRDRPGEQWEDIRPVREANQNTFFNSRLLAAGAYRYLFTQQGSWIVLAPGRRVSVGLRRVLELDNS